MCIRDRRRPAPAAGILRARSAGVVSPHRVAAAAHLQTRYTPDGRRELRVSSESSRVEVKEERRHRSLEPDDDDDARSPDGWRIASVLSDSYLPSTSADCATVDETRRFFSQQSLLLGRKNLLEQASERRRATRMTPKLGLTTLLDAPPSASTDDEKAETQEAEGRDGDVQRSTDISPTDEQTVGGRPVRVLAGSSSPVDAVVSRGWSLTSAERSMETMTVSRPPLSLIHI